MAKNKKKNKRVKKNTKKEEMYIKDIDRAGKTAPKKQNRKVKKDYHKLKKVISNIFKFMVIIAIIAGVAIFLFTSPVFNVKEIQVTNNQKISTEEIKKMSEIQLNENIYKCSKTSIRDKIKQNPYIDEVQVFRLLPDKIEIEVKERVATFMIEIDGKYAYMNNQGYILEINKENIYLPIISGYSTQKENIVPGARLNQEDLKKLDTVLIIVDSANSNQLAELITKIDIKDTCNYTLVLNNEGKTVYLGDASNISTRMYYLKGILQKEKGNEGEIFINGNLNNDRVYFREKVSQ